MGNPEWSLLYQIQKPSWFWRWGSLLSLTYSYLRAHHTYKLIFPTELQKHSPSRTLLIRKFRLLLADCLSYEGGGEDGTGVFLKGLFKWSFEPQRNHLVIIQGKRLFQASWLKCKLFHTGELEASLRVQPSGHNLLVSGRHMRSSVWNPWGQ